MRLVSRLPLRARVMAWFSLVSLVVAGTLALATWHLSTGYMVDQRERSAIAQATGNARLVEAQLRRDPVGLTELMTGLGAEVESAVLLVDGGDVDPAAATGSTRAGCRRSSSTPSGTGQAAHQRTVLDGVPVLAVGLPLPELSATYVEVSPLRELDRTFRFLSWILLAGHGRQRAGRRAARPVGDHPRAAAAAAG